MLLDKRTPSSDEQLCEELSQGCCRERRREIYDELIHRYNRLIQYLVFKNANGHNPEDLFQDGCIGLMKAANTYQKGRGASFCTHLVPWVKAEIIHTRDNDMNIHIPPDVMKAFYKLKSLRDDGSNNDYKKVAETYGIKESTALALSECSIPMDSIDKKTSNSKDKEFDVLEIMGAQNESTGGSVEDMAVRHILMEQIGEYTERLSTSEKAVFCYRHGIRAPEHNWKEICNELNISYNTAVNLERSAIKKLQSMAKKDGYPNE